MQIGYIIRNTDYRQHFRYPLIFIRLETRQYKEILYLCPSKIQHS